MGDYYPHRKTVGHVGDVIASRIGGEVFIIQEESPGYFLAEDPLSPNTDFTAVAKNRVSLRGNVDKAYWVIACPHNVPPDRPLPEATRE